MKFARLALVALWSFSASSILDGAHAQGPEDSCERLLQTVRRGGDEQYSFEVTRNLVDYVHTFDRQFLIELQGLGPTGVYWDLGSGEGLAAEMLRMSGAQYFQVLQTYENGRGAALVLKREAARRLIPFFQIPAKLRPRALAISYRMERLPPRAAGLRFLVDRFFEDIPDSELGMFQLATDFFGVLAYTAHPDAYLRKVLKHMQPGGALYLHSGDVESARVRLKRGRVIPLLEWIALLPGVQLGKRSGHSIRLESSGEIPQIPRLELESADGSLPPARLFREL